MTGSVVVSLINALASIGSVLSLGPGLFMLIHMQALLCVMALIGNLENLLVIKIL